MSEEDHTLQCFYPKNKENFYKKKSGQLTTGVLSVVSQITFTWNEKKIFKPNKKITNLKIFKLTSKDRRKLKKIQMENNSSMTIFNIKPSQKLLNLKAKGKAFQSKMKSSLITAEGVTEKDTLVKIAMQK